jgi:hypothetical protein
MRTLPLLLLACCGLCLACNLPELRFTLPDLCKTVQGMTLPPGSGSRETFSARFDQAIDLSRAGLSEDASFEARLRSVQLTSHSGGTLEWIDEASATLHDPSGSGLPDVALHYARDQAAPAPAAITVPGSDADLAPYLQGGVLKAELGFTGALPRSPASLDVKTCFQVSVPLGGGEDAP